jgi:hypothetical protein
MRFDLGKISSAVGQRLTDMRSLETPALSQRSTRWIKRMARFGYLAKGIVYCAVGILAFQAAANWGGEVTGSKGAMQAIEAPPFGIVLVLLIAIGLAGYATWRFTQVIYNPGHDDHGAKAVGRRVIYLANGLVYGSLSFAAFRIALREPSAESGDSNSQQAATLLAQPFGQWLVALVGVAIAGYGGFCLYRGIRGRFREKLKFSQMSSAQQRWVTGIGRFGLISKGIVSTAISYFFIQTARSANPAEAKTTEGALQTIQQQPFGGFLMGLIALGLMAYGTHMFVQARYRDLDLGE